MAFADLLSTMGGAVLQHLGGAVRYVPEFGDAVDVTGIFDAAYIRVDGEAGVESSGPAVWLRLSDLPKDPDDDEPTITVGGVSYLVHERQRDGFGGVRLLLHRKD